MKKEDIQFIKDNKEIINTIIINASCSYIPLEFRNRMISIGKSLNYSGCFNCNSGLYQLVSFVLDKYKLEEKTSTATPIRKKK